MRDINDYCMSQWSAFRIERMQHRQRNEKLCPLRNLNYANDVYPDYSDDFVRHAYLLRFAYGYTYEYKQMYKYLFEKRRLDPHQKISVTSVGCGSMIDYLGLVSALQSPEVSSKAAIAYTANDLVDWKDLVDIRATDMKYFRPHFGEDAADMFQRLETLDSDVYIFPKSISELPFEVIWKISNAFREKRITKDRIHLLVSIRRRSNDDESAADDGMNWVKIYDLLKTDMLVQGILNNDRSGDTFSVCDLESDTYLKSEEGLRAVYSNETVYGDRDRFLQNLRTYLEKNEGEYIAYLKQQYIDRLLQQGERDGSGYYPRISRADASFTDRTYNNIKNCFEKLHRECIACPEICKSCAENGTNCAKTCPHKAEATLTCLAEENLLKCAASLNRLPIGRTSQLCFVALTFDRKTAESIPDEDFDDPFA